MVESTSIDFNACAVRMSNDIHSDESESRRFINRLSKDNIAQVTVFESLMQSRRHAGSSLCVVNTHLYSNQNRPDVKLWQTAVLIHEMEQFVSHRDVGLIICGDFNSEPESAVYEFIRNGSIHGVHPELEHIENSVVPDFSSLTHGLELSSTMEVAFGSEPSFTNYTTNYKGTLDYIFFSNVNVRTLAVAKTPDESAISSLSDGLPNTQHPSDHIMLCCDVLFASTGAGSLVRGGRIAPPGKHAQSYIMHGGMSGYEGVSNAKGRSPFGKR